MKAAMLERVLVGCVSGNGVNLMQYKNRFPIIKVDILAGIQNHAHFSRVQNRGFITFVVGDGHQQKCRKHQPRNQITFL